MTHTSQYEYLVSAYTQAHELQYTGYDIANMYSSITLDLMHTAEKYLSPIEYRDFIRAIIKL